jgi:hypothetical protein
VMAAAAAAASATVSHEQKGAQEETSLHMRWAPMSVAPTVPEHWLSKAVVQGRLAWQIWLASVQPPQWAVVPHVYLLHLSGGEAGFRQTLRFGSERILLHGQRCDRCASVVAQGAQAGIAAVAEVQASNMLMQCRAQHTATRGGARVRGVHG